MPFGGLVVNRMHVAQEGDGPLPAELGEDLAGRVATAATSSPRSPSARRRASSAYARELGDPPTIVVPELDGDVHDVEGLALMREHLFR